MIYFSVIIPVYNRPDETEELLLSLQNQTSQNFEVILIEDGSSTTCENIVKSEFKFDLQYFFKDNSGPGPSRNYGIEKATTDFFVFFDSDCIVPLDYFKILETYYIKGNLQCFGGPDKANRKFSPIQKAINYSMTSFLTTGGMRGGSDKVIHFHPRSFNMGFSRKVYDDTKGFENMRFGEDIDFSIRTEIAGYKCLLIQECYVYHKRRTDFKKFYKQIYNSGMARIDLFIRHPNSLKITHFLPALFVIYLVFAIIIGIGWTHYYWLVFLLAYLLAILTDATVQYRNLKIGILSAFSTIVQMMGYGLGFLNAFWNRIIQKKPKNEAFSKNFYN